MQPSDVDWGKFWLLEVVILGVPTLVTVLATGGRSPVSPRAVVVLLVVLVALTVVNLLLGLLRGSGRTDRRREDFASRS
jgi:hypothetical protein